ncbi:hypothetical protein [Pseudomonas alkylphenolica]|uniref:Uncharacterized protein n=1 Tax=Pseudomonas alkylphenolica TaxID=237609 RepID=A0A077FAV4_9PSED|nr:hypothetical protein [Pseudomonas alkylphenolica]AIL61655.1 hypothetical protein PSAKL28_24440 [Pseudomonas alkylphenolica]
MNQDVKARLNGFSLEVRDRFKTGEVPTQDDFKLLIDYIHTLHQLLGLETADGAPGAGPGAGLTIASGKVAVDPMATNPTAGKGITVNARAVSVDAGAGLTFSGNKLVVNTAEVYPTAGKGTTANGRAVSVDAGAGLTFSGNKLVVNTAEVYPTAGKGIRVSGTMVSLDDNAWIWILGNLHNASHYCENPYMRCLFFQAYSTVAVRFYYRAYGRTATAFKLNGVDAVRVDHATSTIVFRGDLAEGMIFEARCYQHHGDINMPYTVRVPVQKI